MQRRVNPSIKLTSTHLYTWVERDTVRVNCFSQKDDTVSSAMAGTQTPRSGVERTNETISRRQPIINRGGWLIGVLYTVFY